MADFSESLTPLGVPPVHRQNEYHTPSVPSPLNPDAASRARAAAKPVPREQREKKDSLKKRESAAAARGPTPDLKKPNAKTSKLPMPLRYPTISEPELAAYSAPKPTILNSREPRPLFAPDGQTELKKTDDAYVISTGDFANRYLII
jgi:COMPASS component BRE2